MRTYDMPNLNQRPIISRHWLIEQLLDYPLDCLNWNFEYLVGKLAKILCGTTNFILLIEDNNLSLRDIALFA